MAFAIIYQPLGTHAGRFAGYEVTMFLYAIVVGGVSYVTIQGIKSLPVFSGKSDWTVWKEFFSITIILFAIGIAIYLAGFILEEPAPRLNLTTFLGSLKIALLAGVIPFAFFSLINYRAWFLAAKLKENLPLSNEQTDENIIHITSQLKKEELNFYPREFIYAESDGNYVQFFLVRDSKIIKRAIRNSINNIEEQLTGVPFLLRTHRAFIVNLKKVRNIKGNALGYRLKLSGIDKEIPVSRNNTQRFKTIFLKFK
jgi:hypothetical protein